MYLSDYLHPRIHTWLIQELYIPMTRRHYVHHILQTLRILYTIITHPNDQILLCWSYLKNSRNTMHRKFMCTFQWPDITTFTISYKDLRILYTEIIQTCFRNISASDFSVFTSDEIYQKLAMSKERRISDRQENYRVSSLHRTTTHFHYRNTTDNRAKSVETSNNYETNAFRGNKSVQTGPQVRSNMTRYVNLLLVKDNSVLKLNFH